MLVFPFCVQGGDHITHFSITFTVSYHIAAAEVALLPYTLPVL